jgi:hypothetical protein
LVWHQQKIGTIEFGPDGVEVFLPDDRAAIKGKFLSHQYSEILALVDRAKRAGGAPNH